MSIERTVMQKNAFVFPGQGSQKVGMGLDLVREWPELIEEHYRAADEILGFPLSSYCWEGPAADLRHMPITQPAVLLTSLISLRVLTENGLRPDVVAGHSLGEFTALVCAGVLEWTDALRLVRLRGELMAGVNDRVSGTMVAVVGLALPEIEDMCDKAAADTTEVVEIANYNDPQQVVVSGQTAAVARLMELVQDAGAERVVTLEIGGPAHSSLMGQIVDEFAAALAEVRFNDPLVPVYSGDTADRVLTGDAARGCLRRQLTGRVRWTDVVARMADAGVSRFVEIGPGRVLSRLCGRIRPEVPTSRTNDVTHLRQTLAELRGVSRAPAQRARSFPLHDPPIALLLPGQGSQHPRMAVDLYGPEPVFTAVMDEFFALAGDHGTEVRSAWLDPDDHETVHAGTHAQSLLFAIGYALGRTLSDRGIRPVALLGHSAGELAAAALAGVYDLPSAARIMAARAHSLRLAPAGGMLAVAAAPEVALAHVRAEWVEAGVGLGAYNAPAQTVLAGPRDELADTDTALRAADLMTRTVRATEPWHSPVMGKAAEEFTRAVSAEPLAAPSTTIISARTAQQVKPDQARDGEFWAGQMAEPVRFWPALRALLAGGDLTLVEAGPGAGLSVIARKHPAVRSGSSKVLALLPPERKPTLPHWQAAIERLADLRTERA
jgi:[acyl-carrier-protein] S-malonyltransferase